MTNILSCQTYSFVKYPSVSLTPSRDKYPCVSFNLSCHFNSRVNFLPSQTSYRILSSLDKFPPVASTLSCKTLYSVKSTRYSLLKHPPVSNILPCQVGKAHQTQIHLHLTCRRTARSSSGRVTLSSQLCINMLAVPHNNMPQLCMPHPSSPETLYIISLAFLDPELCTSARVFDISSCTAHRTVELFQ